MLGYNDNEITKITPAIWFGGEFNLKFTVPIYQRLFTWGNEQFDRLLNDLKEWEGNEPYYLGIITVVKKDDKYILIDGQQRLTVIAILAGVLGWCSHKDPENFLAYEARPADQKALKKIWEFGKTWIEAESKLEQVLEASGISSESMVKFIRHIARNRNDWKGKSQALLKNLTLLISKLPEVYGTGANTNLQNEYFEKMNSAGKQLEPHEILKVRICKQSTDFAVWNRVEDFTMCYVDVSQNDDNDSVSQDWITILHVLDASKEDNGIIIETKGNDEKTERKKVTIKIRDDNSRLKSSIEKWRPALIDFPMFLLHVLKILKEDDFSIPNDSHNLLKNFEGQLPDDKNKFCKEMKNYRKFLDSWIIHREVNDESDDNDSKYAFWNNTKEVMCLEGGDGQCDSSMTVKKIKQLQMILYALGGQKQEWLYEAYKVAYNEAGWGNLSNRKEQLNGWYKWLRARLIHEANFKCKGEKWSDTYLTYGNVRPVHFMCLDYFLWELSNETINDRLGLVSKVYGEEIIPQAVRNFVPRTHRSVEHFHPQTDDNSQHRGSFADQTDPIKNVKGWGATIDNDQTSIKNIFGNLALISAGRNSEYSNMSVAGKSERIEKLVKEGRLESIKLFLMKQACQGKDVNWLPVKAQEHADLMLEVIKWGLKLNEVSESLSSVSANES